MGKTLKEEKLNGNAQCSHGLDASPIRLESQGGDFSGDRAGAGASRLLRRKVRGLSVAREIPADASGAAWPCAQTNDINFSGAEGDLWPRVTERLQDRQNSA